MCSLRTVTQQGRAAGLGGGTSETGGLGRKGSTADCFLSACPVPGTAQRPPGRTRPEVPEHSTAVLSPEVSVWPMQAVRCVGS